MLLVLSVRSLPRCRRRSVGRRSRSVSESLTVGGEYSESRGRERARALESWEEEETAPSLCGNFLVYTSRPNLRMYSDYNFVKRVH